jgi:hypothetical protein
VGQWNGAGEEPAGVDMARSAETQTREHRRGQREI